MVLSTVLLVIRNKCQGSTRGLGVSWPEITAFQALKSNCLTDGLTGGIPCLPDGLTEGEARNLVYLVHGQIPSVEGKGPRVHESTYSLVPLSRTARQQAMISVHSAG